MRQGSAKTNCKEVKGGRGTHFGYFYKSAIQNHLIFSWNIVLVFLLVRDYYYKFFFFFFACFLKMSYFTLSLKYIFSEHIILFCQFFSFSTLRCHCAVWLPWFQMKSWLSILLLFLEVNVSFIYGWFCNLCFGYGFWYIYFWKMHRPWKITMT